MKTNTSFFLNKVSRFPIDIAHTENELSIE